MSKLGKKPIQIPKDTKITVETGKLILNGPMGSKELTINEKIFSTTISKENNLMLDLINKKNKDKDSMMWGTTRSILNSAIIGVSKGHEKILELTGVGYRANLKGDKLNLQLGFSHDTLYDIPKGAKVTVEKSTVIKISGIDKELVGKIASDIKMLKPVEPYKGKGIKEKGQYVLRKEGKKK
jgi:large subunit ribosomal protein L6